MPLDVDNNKGELVIDPYKHKEKFKNWDKKISTVSKANEEIIVRYLEDIRKGVNINPKARKGKRGYHRLNSQRHRMKRITELLEKQYGIKNLAVKTPEEAEKIEDSIRDLFEKMEEGDIKRQDGKRYLAVRDYIKGFKAFWHWYMVYMKRENKILVPDITEYIAVKEDRKPQFAYFGEVGSVTVEEAFKKLLNYAKPEYKVLMSFLFDSGIRCPTEMMNVKRKDIVPIKDSPYFWLNIREETSKTFGRRIKLMLCHELLIEYIKEKDFNQEDFIFPITPRVINQYLTRLGEKVLGKKGVTMYDFRHNSSCYWLPRYKNESALMYRFGWKDSKMIYYYSEFMGMKDTIMDEDILIDVTKTQLEKQLEKEKTERELMEEQLNVLQNSQKKLQEDAEKRKLKDDIVMKIIQGLVKKGKIDDAIELVHDENLEKELAKLTG